MSTLPAAAKEAVKDEANGLIVCEFIGVQREILDGLRSAGYCDCRELSYWE
ncbi:MAG: hypothetical protein AABN95_10565 [Acidobacteriota bacterium]